MEVIKLNECGYDEAKYGFSLSFKDRAIPKNEWWCSAFDECRYAVGTFENENCIECPLMKRDKHYDGVLKANAPRNGGHNKFLEHIMVWLDIEAPRYFWSEFDTYRVGVSKQSESTMHTLQKRMMSTDDIEQTSMLTKEIINQQVLLFNDLRSFVGVDIQDLKSVVPDGYKQRREVVLNYKVLAHIIVQRYNHRLPEWRFFIEEIYKMVEHPELLPDLDKLRSS